VNTQTNKRVANDLQLKFWRAEDRMRAAEVPAADRVDSGSIEPVTVSGYYEIRTKSGNPAWAYFQWSNGTLAETHCTYDTASRRKCDELIGLGADPFWKDV
jgi:hypothetical protein